MNNFKMQNNTSDKNPADITLKRIDTLADILDTVWVVICGVMIILA